ncbi:MAG: MFS transporter, partial [Clostridia bacterium]|nr:MFS transporter [Clostridia bacterium]
FGYRNAYYITTSILVAVLILMLVFYKEKPTPVGFSEKKKPKGDVTWPGLSLKEALKKPLFYIVLFCVFLIGVVLQGITSVYAAHLKDVGFDAGFVATVVGIHSITLAVSKIISGFIYDKFGIRVNILVCTVAGIVALFSFLSLGNSAACTALAIVAAVTFAFALPLETVMLPLFTGNFFGLKDYNKILGIVCSVAAVGFATGVPLMNAVYDVFGSYFYGLVAAIVLLFTVTVTMQFAINISNRFKKETEV